MESTERFMDSNDEVVEKKCTDNDIGVPKLQESLDRSLESTSSRKRCASQSPEREFKDHIPRDDKLREQLYNRGEQQSDRYPRHKFRRTYNRNETRDDNRYDSRHDVRYDRRHDGRYEQRYDNRYPRGSQYRGPQRRLPEGWSPEEARNRRNNIQIITVLDKFDSAKEDILTLTDSLAVVGDTSNQAFITLESSIEAFSIKTGAYASVIGIFMAKGMTNLAETVARHVMQNLRSALNAGNRIAAINCLRFLIGAYSANVKCCNALEVIGFLIQQAKKLENANYESQEEYVKGTLAADNLIYIVAASIPWFSAEEVEKNREQLEGFCDDISEYGYRRNDKLGAISTDGKGYQNGSASRLEGMTNPYVYLEAYKESSNLRNYTDRLFSAVDCLKSLVLNNWKNNTTYRFYQSKGIKEHIFDNNNNKDEEGSEDTQMVTNDLIDVIKAIDLSKIRNFGPVPFTGFTFISSAEETCDITVHDKWLLEEHILHTINNFADDTALCAKQLLMLPHNSQYREHAIVEMLFNVMLSPFYNHHYTLFAVLVMQEMCISEPKVGTLFEQFYSELTDNMENLDTSVINCIITAGAYWFSVEFCKIRKPGSKRTEDDDEPVNMEVEEDLDQEDQLKQRIREKNQRLFAIMFKHSNNFVMNFNNRLLDKISRLIYPDRLMNYSPYDLKGSIKALFQPSLQPIQCLIKDKPLEYKVFQTMLHFNKVSPEERGAINSRIINFVNDHVNQKPLKDIPFELLKDYKSKDIAMGEAAAEGSTDVAKPETSVKLWMEYELVLIFWETVLMLGNKTLTHLIRLVENHGEVLSHFVSRDQYVTFEDSVISKVLRLTREAMQYDSKRLELLMETLLREGIVKPEEASRFVFAYFPNPEFFSNQTFAIIQSAIDVSNKRLQEARTRYSEAIEGKDELLRELEKQEILCHSFFMTIAEQVNNKLAQGLSQELEAFLENMLKNVIVLGARNSVMLVPLLAEVQQQGYHQRAVSAVRVALLSQYVKPLH